jgi:transketolase
VSTTHVAQPTTATQIDQLCIDTIRTLSIDAVQQAKSGHPGTPMALAPLVYTLWNRVMHFDPDDPIWPNRDRFVLSNGHASMLLWSVLHLTKTQAVNSDYERLGQPSVTLDDIRRFRQLDSKAPGHPEYHWVSGVETTTGPLGQGVATSVGMAIAQKWLASRYNRPGFDIFDYNIYAVCGDGCMMEGIASEAASLAAHLGLDNLCWVFDNNHITIEGHTRITFTEDVAARFLAYGWNVLRVGDANDIDRIEHALEVFRKTKGRPTFIVLDSHIGYGSPHKQDTPERTANRSATTKSALSNAATDGPKRRSSSCRLASTSISPKRWANAAQPRGDSGRSCSTHTRSATPSSRLKSSRCSAACFPLGGTATCRSSRRTRKASPDERRQERC